MKYLMGSSNADSKVNYNLVRKCFERLSESASIFSAQLLHEMMYLEKDLFNRLNKWTYRINQPGIMDSKNWTLKIPLSLEDLVNSKKGQRIIKTIRKISSKTGRD
jgi:4-alpha-glucanotransferase